MKESLGAKALAYPAPVFVVGSYDREGKPNAITVSWAGICCSQPPCVAVSIRKATESYENVFRRKAFTVSIPSEKHVKEADYFGLISGRNSDKLAATKLTAVKSKLVDAPYIKEFPINFECKVVDVAEIGMHTQFIGEIMDVKADSEVLGRDGSVQLDKLKPLFYTPDTQQYYGVGAFVASVFSAGKNI
jgi:flavin reductase (DIM6/NTAB) family NADH-FMN oxidoreductase RutF